MIPRRISLKGILCYRDEPVIDFDDADLWAFTGPQRQRQVGRLRRDD